MHDEPILTRKITVESWNFILVLASNAKFVLNSQFFLAVMSVVIGKPKQEVPIKLEQIKISGLPRAETEIFNSCLL